MLVGTLLKVQQFIHNNKMALKVAVNRKLQKFMHGLFNLVVHIELCMCSFL